MSNVRAIITENNTKNTLFVLKGFLPEDYGYHKVNLEDTLDNKLGRLFALSMEEEKVIAFDEFVALYDLIMNAFQQIVIIENPLYVNLYPAGVILSEKTKKTLLTHFDDEAESDTELDETSELSDIYNNFVETGYGIACCFNLDPSKLKHEKILQMEGFAVSPTELKHIEDASAIRQINICTDIEYFELICLLEQNSETIYTVNYNSYVGGGAVMAYALAKLNGYYKGRIVLSTEFSSMGTDMVHYPEITELMKHYWGYDSYRNIRVYDIDALEKRQKKVVSVSQEQIISNLVTQVEKCREGQSFQDIFVTAPTGSGKSLMFQLPAMYLAEKYGLLTIVITPLIGLMNDQVQALESKGYHGARTINSDIAPIIKNEILEEVANGTCNILYLSPESLLSRSDVSQLIGSRRIGMIIVDEAHIVTTWGKQFRPDYWFLGDHVSKLRTTQNKAKENPMSFVIATFTATAIYKGNEDMYGETLNSLHMIDPITYLGYVKRDNIEIKVSEIEAIRNRTEYELDKFDILITQINIALLQNKKILIYFPTVELIRRFYSYCISKNLMDYVATYHGNMKGDEKNESFHAFLNGTKPVMLATKAFGMGIDIPDIAVVSHYAPTGNVCDYMQEIGRAARDINIDGQAIYKHMSNDFQHINRLHGLSTVYRGQLVAVSNKILELFSEERYSDTRSSRMKKRNEMLIDTESFAYIFDGPMVDENNLVNKVKTAMLLIQKDYERRGYMPFRMRPIPIFAYGYLALKAEVRTKLEQLYPKTVEVMNRNLNVCKVDLKKIWQTSYEDKMSFPKFKYLLYSGNNELAFNQQFKFSTAMAVDIHMEPNAEMEFLKMFQGVKDVINTSARNNSFYSEEELITMLTKNIGISSYRAENILRIVVAAMNTYGKEYAKGTQGHMMNTRSLNNGVIKYQFETACRDFFAWIEKGWKKTLEETVDKCMYITNEGNSGYTKEITTVLGVLEALGVLHFKSLGGTNSQIYLYINETKTMRMVKDKPELYRNRLLEEIGKRHTESVAMMNSLFQSKYTSEEIWEHLENYFLGICECSD